MPDNIKKIFAHNLNKLIEASGLTQIYVAEKIGVSPASVSEWVKGKKTPRMDKIQKLANLFGVKVSYFTAESVTDDDITDMERLEALHQNPRLGMLFDRQRNMSQKDIEFMLEMADRIMKDVDR